MSNLCICNQFQISAIIQISHKNIDELKNNLSSSFIEFEMGDVSIISRPEVISEDSKYYLLLVFQNKNNNSYEFTRSEISISNVPFFDIGSDRYIEIVRPALGQLIVAYFLAFPFEELHVLSGEYHEGDFVESINDMQLMPVQVQKYEILQDQIVISFQQVWNWLDRYVFFDKGKPLYRVYSLLTYMMNSFEYQQFAYAISAIEILLIPEGKSADRKSCRMRNRLGMIVGSSDNDVVQNVINIYGKRSAMFHQGIGVMDYYSEEIYISDEFIDETIAILVFLIRRLIDNDAYGFDFSDEVNGKYSYLRE